MGTSYATPAQFYRYGLPRAALARAFEVAFTADASTNVCTSLEHGLVDGDTVFASNIGGALPAGLVAGTTYYVVSATAGTFQLSATLAGAAIDLTTAGTGTSSWAPTDGVTPYLEAGSRELDRYLGQGGVLTTWGLAEAVDVCAIAAYVLVSSSKVRVPGDPSNVEDVVARYTLTMKKLEKILAQQIPTPTVDDGNGVDEQGALGWSDDDRGWSTGGL